MRQLFQMWINKSGNFNLDLLLRAFRSDADQEWKKPGLDPFSLCLLLIESYRDKDPLHVTEYFPELHSSSCSSRLEGIRTKHGCQNELIINENINGHLIIYIFVSLNHNQLKQIYFTWKWFFFCSDGGRERNSVELPVNPLVNCHI